jgi:3-methyladenine DNA glycosylase/8-oxoguanine DNA glycosylase
MFLMFRLGRPDVLLVGDLGIRWAIMVNSGLDKMPGSARLTAGPIDPGRQSDQRGTA